jgi:NAD(P)-dependent dehydrogenase (short-subunit alcohol dehydrogenase family)
VGLDGPVRLDGPVSLDGQVVLITGGGSGIGRATALELSRRGAAVAVADIDAGAADRVAGEIVESGGRATAFWCDVMLEPQVQACVAGVEERFGGLHVLVNCAGVLQGAYREIEEVDLDTFRRVLDVNLIGTFLCSRAAVGAIEQSGGGVILCIASGAGVRGPSSSLAYAASKGGVHGFAMTLERQLRPRGIRVNVVCPGSIDTPMKRRNLEEGAAQSGRDPAEHLAAAGLGEPEGLARVLAFLASDEAAYVTGALFTR